MVNLCVKTVLRWCLALLGMTIVLFEQILWSVLGGMMRLLGRLAPIAWVEDWIRRLPPILALPLFILPWLIMLPVKLGALWLIATGKVIKGTLLFVGGEAFGVAFLARLYELCRPALHRWPWFVIVERVFLRWTHWAHQIFSQLPMVKSSQALWHRWSTEMRHWVASIRQGKEPPQQ